MDEKLVKSLDMIWIQANRHCYRHRLCDPAKGLSIEQARSIASRMLDLFEREAAEYSQNGAGGGAETPSGSNADGVSGSEIVRRSRRPESR